jgi:hypothetical protein
LEGLPAGIEGLPAEMANSPDTVVLANPLGDIDKPAELIGRVIRAILGLSGSLALALFIYGGFIWMTSGGSPYRIWQGKQIVFCAALGMAAIFSAYALIFSSYLFYFFSIFSLTDFKLSLIK